jgi:cysteinyl-tRNA synthetase
MTTILDLIGNTPLVEIQRMNSNPNVTVLAKLEYLNPGGSIKDRAALYMIEAAERSGELTPEKTVVEATSGNTGIGLAMVCAFKGYNLLLTMSSSASLERQQILRARGAQIRLTPGHLSTDGAIEEAYRLMREHPDRYYATDQFNNEANWKAHYHGTANEIWDQTNGTVTALVATLGTSGTLMGLSRRMKELNPDIAIVGVEPYMGHKIQGLKNMKESYQPGIFNKERIDRKINVDDEEAFDTARRLAKEEGLFVGMSSGAAMAVALQQAATMQCGTIVAILPDSGERYLSTSLFAEQKKGGFSLFNTRTHVKQVFETIEAGKASVYTTGPTAHGPLNVGEARRLAVADLVNRYLIFRGLSVRHVMNITDLDDKTYQGADAASTTPGEFADANIASFRKDLEAMSIALDSECPRSSEHVEDMIAVAEQLVSKGFAYEKLQSLYFDISRFGDYGQLSGIDLDKIRLGATVDLDDYEKDNPRDFTLLKRVKLADLKKGLYTKTQWGNVRPSWPLQCATVALQHLGETCDIHIAGRELMFPLHENEIAIAGALNKKPLARFWLHCDRVLVDGKKMDETAGGLPVRSLIDAGWTGREIRFWLLSSHYRKPVLLSDERLGDARRTLRRLDGCMTALQQLEGGLPYPELDQLLYDLKSGFGSAMEDDLNISVALAAIFRAIKQLNRLMTAGRIAADQVPKVMDGFRQLDTVLQIFDFKASGEDPVVADLQRRREAARRARDWDLADALRQQLSDLGVVVRDGKV